MFDSKNSKIISINYKEHILSKLTLKELKTCLSTNISNFSYCLISFFKGHQTVRKEIEKIMISNDSAVLVIKNKEN